MKLFVTKPSLLGSLVAILIGLLFVFASDIILKYIVVVTGAALVLASTLSLASYCSRRTKVDPKTLKFPLESIAAIIFGIFLISSPSYFIAFIMIILGLILLLVSTSQFFTYIQIRRMSPSVPLVIFLVPIVLFFASLLIIINPFAFAQSILLVSVGLTTLIYGLSNAISYFVSK